MSKTYRTPIVAAIGTADVMTSGLPTGTIKEMPSGPATWTTHAMLDL
jgi:hypothetical protein